MQTILILSTFVLYLFLNVLFFKSKTLANNSKILQNLIVKDEDLIISKVYDKIRNRYHAFFMLLLVALLMRTAFYVMLRIQNFTYIFDFKHFTKK